MESSRTDRWRLATADRIALASNSWFAGLQSETRHDLLRALRVRSYEHGETIFGAGAPVRSWKVCLGGSVRIGTCLATRRSLTLRFLRPGQWFGDLPSAEGTHTHDAFAHGPTRIGAVDGNDVLVLMDKHPEFHAALLKWQSMRLASVFRLLEDHATASVRERVARQLARLAKDHGVPCEREVRIGIQLTQSDLAALVGCSRQRANQQVRYLAAQGVLRQHQGCLIVSDGPALKKLAN
jgi:CRP-like cAMP-binding protein